MSISMLADQLLDHKVQPFNEGDILVLRVPKITHDIIMDAELLKPAIKASAVIVMEADEVFDLRVLNEDEMRRHGWVRANA